MKLQFFKKRQANYIDRHSFIRMHSLSLRNSIMLAPLKSDLRNQRAIIGNRTKAIR